MRRLQHEAVHIYFKLSYSNYLVIPRSVLQSMPDKWQEKFIKLVEEMDEKIGWRNNLDPVEEYRVIPVKLKYTGEYDDYDGREIVEDIEVEDKYMDYDRGRKIWKKVQSNKSKVEMEGL